MAGTKTKDGGAPYSYNVFFKDKNGLKGHLQVTAETYDEFTASIGEAQMALAELGAQPEYGSSQEASTGNKSNQTSPMEAAAKNVFGAAKECPNGCGLMEYVDRPYTYKRGPNAGQPGKPFFSCQKCKEKAPA